MIKCCTSKYLDSPTTLSVKRIKIQETIFPEFTICPDIFQTYRDEILYQYNLTDDDLRNLIYPIHNDTAEFYKEATWEIDEILDNIIVNTRKAKFQIRFGEESEKDILSITENNKTSIGRCYSFQIPKWMINEKV